ncbi:MAG: hypothetical protein AAF597_14285 [Bacteroidota bacterium]
MHYTKLSPLLLLLFVFLFATCTNDETNGNTPMGDITIWSGPSITFTKANNADPNDAANQDRITDNVWITRGNDGGQIYNAVTESMAEQNSSPAGTQWARGTTANLNDLTFGTFRSTIRPQNVVGQDLVLLLTEENIAIDIRFTSWSRSMAGGFTYSRSTE